MSEDRFTSLFSQVSKARESALPFPKVFSDPVDLSIPGALSDFAARAAASREFMAEVVSRSRRAVSLAETMLVALEHDVSVEVDRRLVEQSNRMIAGGSAWQERSAAANLSVLDRRVELRGVEMRLRNAKAQLREMEDCYEAWRQTEWALDRQARLLQIRSQLGEV